MKTIYILSIGAIAAVGVTGAIWWGMTTATPTQKAAPTKPSQQTQTKSVLSAEGTFEGSVYELADSGESYICTVEHSVQGINSKGTVYIAGKQIKAEFISSVPVIGVVTTYMVATADTVYTWTSLMNQGVRSSRSAEAQDTTSTNGQTVDLNQQLSYSCTPWQADMSVFEVPTTISFRSV